MLHFLPILIFAGTVSPVQAKDAAPTAPKATPPAVVTPTKPSRENLLIEVAVEDSKGRRFVNFKRRDQLADDEQDRAHPNPDFVNRDETFYCESKTCWQVHMLGGSIGAPTFDVTFEAKGAKGGKARIESDLKAHSYKLICSETVTTPLKQITGKALDDLQKDFRKGRITLTPLPEKPAAKPKAKSPCP